MKFVNVFLEFWTFGTKICWDRKKEFRESGLGKGGADDERVIGCFHVNQKGDDFVI